MGHEVHSLYIPGAAAQLEEPASVTVVRKARYTQYTSSGLATIKIRLPFEVDVVEQRVFPVTGNRTTTWYAFNARAILTDLEINLDASAENVRVTRWSLDSDTTTILDYTEPFSARRTGTLAIGPGVRNAIDGPQILGPLVVSLEATIPLALRGNWLRVNWAGIRYLEDLQYHTVVR